MKLNTNDNIVTALQEIIDEYNKYRRLAATAYAKKLYITRYEEITDENLEEIANWFDTLAKAERMEAKLYEDALKTLLD